MSRLKLLAASTFTVVSLSSASGQDTASAERDSRLDGEWRGLAVKSSLGTQLALSLFNDGSYVRRMVIVNEFAWTAEPNILNIAPVTRKGDEVEYGQPMALAMRVNGQSLTTRFGKDSIILYRLGRPAADSSFIGRWVGETAAHEEIVEEFAEDGQLLVMVTIARDAGRFSVDHDAIHWQQQIPNDSKSISRFKLDGKKLKLFNGSGHSVELKRGPIQPLAN